MSKGSFREQVRGCCRLIRGRVSRQGRGGLLPYSSEVLHSPVRSGCECLDAQGLEEFRHRVVKVGGYRVHASGDGCAGFLLGELFHWLEVRDERQGEARRV